MSQLDNVLQTDESIQTDELFYISSIFFDISFDNSRKISNDISIEKNSDISSIFSPIYRDISENIDDISGFFRYIAIFFNIRYFSIFDILEKYRTIYRSMLFADL